MMKYPIFTTSTRKKKKSFFYQLKDTLSGKILDNDFSFLEGSIIVNL